MTIIDRRQELLYVKNLSIYYNNKQILHDITFGPLIRGEVTALLGPNGSGKSTIMRVLSGIEQGSGKICLGDIDLGKLSIGKRANYCAYLPQTLPPCVHLQVIEALLIAHKIEKKGLALSLNKCLANSLEILSDLGIEGLCEKYMDELSGGQRQLIGLAQSLVRRPQILLLDEPISALDLRHQYIVMDVIRQEARKRGIIVIVVLHDITTALQFADKVMLLANGQLISEGLPHDVITEEALLSVYGVTIQLETTSTGQLYVQVNGIDQNFCDKV